MDKQAYGQLVKELSPSSPVTLDIVKAFFAGGAICTVGELLRNIFLSYGMPEKSAATWVSITLIVTAQLLTGLGIFDKFAKHAGAGASVPITGFANAVVSPAMEYHTEGLVMGLGAKLFTIAGPVIVYGTAASVLAGLLYYIKEVFMR